MTGAMNDIEDVPKPRPKAPDGGWSWVVVASAFYNSIIIVGMPLTFGIVFNQKLTMMGVSSTTVAWIYNLFNFNFFISSVFSAPLSDVFSWRSVSFGATCITGFAYALMVFASNATIIFLLFSVIAGYSAGLCAFIGFLLIPHYFDIHRGRAGAVMMTGASTGQIIIPLLMHYLHDEFGFYGACLIFAGLVLNCAVASLLFYPVKKRPLIRGDKMYETAKLKHKTVPSQVEDPESSTSKTELNGKPTISSQTPWDKIKDILCITLLNICQLQHLMLLLVNLSFAFLMTGYGNFTALFPFAMAARGHPASTISYSLSIGAAANTAVRMFISWASDAQWFSRKICYIFGAALSGTATVATVFVLHDARFIIACQVFWGIGIGASLSVFHNLLMDTCGRELYDAGISTNGLLKAGFSIGLGPLIGVARDHTSYEVAVGLTGACLLISALLWLFMPLAG